MHAATKIELREIGTIKPYEKNAKRHPKEQIEKLAAIIKRHGFDQPIVVDEHGVIIKGHGRLLASKHLGLKKVPVLVRNDLTPAQVREARIADNRVSELGSWDISLIAADVHDATSLDGFDVLFTAFTDEELGLADINNARGLDDLPVLPMKGKSQFCQITFNLHEKQADVVREAIARAKLKKNDTSHINENANGNALFLVCREWVGESL